MAKSFVAELTPLHTLSAWGFKEEMVRTMRLVVFVIIFLKKKKKLASDLG